jgi:hypothetical protein
MAGLGAVELVIIGVFLLVGVAAALSGRTTKLVLQKLVAHEAASSESQPVIELVGRQQGLISFLLTLVGISPITDFKITPDELCCNSTSLFGRQNQAVPLRAISSVAAGVRKPVGYLFLAFVFLVVGVFGGLGVLWNEGILRFLLTLLVFGAFVGLFTWLYVINKRFFVSIHTHGGPPVLLSLKPNVIEGVPLDLERALQVVKIIRERVLASTGPAAVAPLGSTPGRATHDRPAGQPPPAAFDPAPIAPSTFEYDDFAAEPPEPARPESLLQQARELIKQGQRQAAIGVLQEIVLQFPQSAEAGMARATLEKAGISV